MSVCSETNGVGSFSSKSAPIGFGRRNGVWQRSDAIGSGRAEHGLYEIRFGRILGESKPHELQRGIPLDQWLPETRNLALQVWKLNIVQLFETLQRHQNGIWEPGARMVATVLLQFKHQTYKFRVAPKYLNLVSDGWKLCLNRCKVGFIVKSHIVHRR